MSRPPNAGVTLRQALRRSAALPIDVRTIEKCLDHGERFDRLLRRVRVDGLKSLDRSERSGHLWRVVGDVAESVAEVVLTEMGYDVFWHLTEAGAHGVDLLLLAPDDSVLALEVKGTLRQGSIPRLTPSRLRQMSREWLNQADNPGMSDWALEADDLYTAVMVVDLSAAAYRVALSSDFEAYVPVSDVAQLQSPRAAEGRLAAVDHNRVESKGDADQDHHGRGAAGS